APCSAVLSLCSSVFFTDPATIVLYTLSLHDALPIWPSLAPLLELHTLQALDATLAGASLREVAEGLFGADAVADDWHADSALRARVRRLVRRGNALMRGGYRRLVQLPPVEQGRSAVTAKRP